MSTTDDTYSGWCCTNCAMLIANGEPPITDPATGEDMSEAGTAAWLEGFAARNAGIHWAIGDDEQPFSWSSCDTCGSNLGGARHEVHGWEVTS